MRVMFQYLTDRLLEGLRGQGLTYGASLSMSVTDGRFSLDISMTSQVVEAYKETRKILERLVNVECK